MAMAAWKPPVPMRPPLGEMIVSVSMADVLGMPDGCTQVNAVDRWMNSERRWCVVIEWRDEDGIPQWDCLYACDVYASDVKPDLYEIESMVA